MKFKDDSEKTKMSKLKKYLNVMQAMLNKKEKYDPP